jgi:hypothetical protein
MKNESHALKVEIGFDMADGIQHASMFADIRFVLRSLMGHAL